MLRGILVAISANGVIGVDNRLPWHYPADLQRVKRLTTGNTIVMGRLTYTSIGKPLPNRRNIVVTRGHIDGVECVASLAAAVALAEKDPVGDTLWFFGGARIFAEAMPLCDVIDVTHVPDVIEDVNAVKFPSIDPSLWRSEGTTTLPDDPRLQHTVYRRRA